ncbi:MAG TPA: hypothetical protein DF383_00195 [Deltaproteobacteria bacterium]|nr:hypothetical protein [Deltaproteobacteria bacterium]
MRNEFKPGAVIGSANLPFESMLFPKEPEAKPQAPAKISTVDTAQSKYIAQDVKHRLPPGWRTPLT